MFEEPALCLPARYRQNSLLLCKANRLKSVAFPAISCGSLGYPADEAAEVSRDVAMLENAPGRSIQLH